MADTGEFTMRRFEGPLAERARQQLKDSYPDFVEILPGKMIMPHRFREYFKKFQDFEVKDSDVWVISYPKAGTTWTQEMVWCILNDLDFEGAKQDLMLRFPFFEWDSLMPENMEDFKMSKDNPCMVGNQWKILHSSKSPRTIKAHLIKQLLPTQTWTKKPKLIYVCRDPRDVCVSYYYHSVKLDGYTGNFDEFTELFLADALPWSPFWMNVLEFWKIRDQENVLFIRFEDMKKDLPSVIRQVCRFLGKELTQKQFEELADHLSFESMRKNPAVNNEKLPSMGLLMNKEIKFMRKGKVGDWRNHFSEAQKKQFQTWTRDNLKGTDFPYYQDYD